MTSRAKIAVWLCVAGALAGCGVLDPYETLPRATQPGQPAGQRVGVCYNTLESTPAEVEAEAQRDCAANTVAQRVDTDWYMQNCPLLLPARATFVCTATK